MRERPGERREPGQETVFVITDHPSATFAAHAAAATLAFLGLEVAPTASLLSQQLGCSTVLERLVVLDEVEAQTVDAVGGVDGGFDLGFAAIEGVEEGDGDGGIVLGNAETHLVESIAGGRVAVLGEVADAFGLVSRAVGDRVEAEESPDLGSAVEAVRRAQAGEVGGGVHLAQARDGDEVAGWGLREKWYEAATALVDEVFSGGVLAEEALELLGEGCRDLEREQNGVFGPGTQGVEHSGASAADVLAVEVEDLLVGHGDQVIGIGTVSQ
jgi:hypothetical protein